MTINPAVRSRTVRAVMDIPERPRILFIRGVFKQTARRIDDICEEQSVARETPSEYSRITSDAWHAVPAVLCTTCHARADRRLFVPQNMDRSATGPVWQTHSCARFCSWTCAAWHVRYVLESDERYKLQLLRLYREIEGEEITGIPASVAPWRLEEFGGSLTRLAWDRVNESNFARMRAE